jgi:hypothetical protein
MKRILFGLAVATMALPQLVFSQDGAAKADLVAAIGKLSQRDVSLVGSIDEEVQDEPAAGIAGGVQRVVISSFSTGAAKEYQGDIEILAVKSGDLVIASKDELPGVKVFKTGDDVLCLQAHQQEPFSTTKLVKNVSKLVDWAALEKAVESASKVRSTAKGKDVEIRVVLDASYIPNDVPAGLPPGLAGGVAGGAAGKNVKIQINGGPMVPSIVELAATFQINSNKEIVGLAYSLQYDDPMKGMMAQAMKAGGGAIQFGAKPAKPNAEPDLGKQIIYDFDVVAKPSEKVSEFINQAKTMLKNRK